MRRDRSPLRPLAMLAGCLSAACDPGLDPPVGVHDVAEASLASWMGVLPSRWALGTDCLTPDCLTLRLRLEPLAYQPQWFVNGNPVQGGSSLDIPAPPSGAFVEIEVHAENRVARQIVSSVGVVDDVVGIIILGSQDDLCQWFYIRSVGGCVVQPDGLFFEQALNGVIDPAMEVAFDTAPIDLVLEGHSTFARWTTSPGVLVDDGRTPPMTFMPPAFLHGLEYWYALDDGDVADMYAIHGPGGAPELLQRSTCSQGGVGALLRTP